MNYSKWMNARFELAGLIVATGADPNLTVQYTAAQLEQQNTVHAKIIGCVWLFEYGSMWLFEYGSMLVVSCADRFWYARHRYVCAWLI